MRAKAKCIGYAALATLVAGVVICFVSFEAEVTPPPVVVTAHEPAPARQLVDVATNRAEVVHKAEATQRIKAKKLPDAMMRYLVEKAVSDNDYKKLSQYLKMLDRIADPAIRMRLLDGLSWFEETCVMDAIPFLLDDDEQIATTASQIVTSRIKTIPRFIDREKVYIATLKVLPNSADRDILISTLEGERKGVLLHVLRDLESKKKSDPVLWEKLTDVYKAQFDRPYGGVIDALLHYNPRED